MQRAALASLVFALGLACGGVAVLAWRRPAALDVARPARRWEATVYLPLVDNQDRRLTEEEWRSAIAPLIEAFGGVTFGGAQEGCWRDAGGRMRCEPVRPVIVSFDSHRLDEFRRTLHEVGRRLGQEALYVRFEEPHVEVLEVESDASAKRR